MDKNKDVVQMKTFHSVAYRPALLRSYIFSNVVEPINDKHK